MQKIHYTLNVFELKCGPVSSGWNWPSGRNNQPCLLIGCWKWLVPLGSHRRAQSVSSIHTSVGRRRHSQLTRLRFHPLGHYRCWFPLPTRCETEKWHFRGLVTVSFYNVKNGSLGRGFQEYAIYCYGFYFPGSQNQFAVERLERCPKGG